MGNWWNRKAVNYIVTPEEWATRCRWEDLTREERRMICRGGCGVNIFGKKIVPDLIFREACCHHDFAYCRGGDEIVRLLCENAFRKDIIGLINRIGDNGWSKYGNFYHAVTSGLGRFVWRYGKMKTKAEILQVASGK